MAIDLYESEDGRHWAMVEDSVYGAFQGSAPKLGFERWGGGRCLDTKRKMIAVGFAESDIEVIKIAVSSFLSELKE